MTRPTPTLTEIAPDDLEAASGGQQLQFKTEGREGSTNVLDCRGDTCLDSTGKVDVEATRAHKQGIHPPIKPLPTGDGGGLGTPRVPKR
jgi:hypothetical protein